MDRTTEIRKVLIITLLLNIIVSGSKIFYGHLTHSVAIFSDGFHSLFDGVSNVVGLIGINISAHPPDETHPYGHRKYETVFAIFVGLLMLLTCFEVFKNVYASFISGSKAAISTTSFLVMLITLGINIFVATYERRKGIALNSEFLVADSQHTRSDIYVTLGVIASLFLIKLGVPFADPIAGAVVGLLVAKAGIDVIKEATEVLVDRTPADVGAIRQIACCVEGVIECHGIRTRGTKGHIFVDLHIVVNPSLSVKAAHDIADLAEEEIKNKIPGVTDVVVHIEPSDTRPS